MLFQFLSLDSMPMNAERDIVMANLSVCPSHSDIVSRRMHISSNSFDSLVGHDTRY